MGQWALENSHENADLTILSGHGGPQKSSKSFNNGTLQQELNSAGFRTYRQNNALQRETVEISLSLTNDLSHWSVTTKWKVTTVPICILDNYNLQLVALETCTKQATDKALLCEHTHTITHASSSHYYYYTVGKQLFIITDRQQTERYQNRSHYRNWQRIQKTHSICSMLDLHERRIDWEKKTSQLPQESSRPVWLKFRVECRVISLRSLL